MELLYGFCASDIAKCLIGQLINSTLKEFLSFMELCTF